ncbi:MAG: prolyl-tRNA synthetase associated domain-containing protein [Gemmobacter sp.]|jgi:Ala-tRNA(Pro) deacylase|nr:prolyl-tRNA synthetase associated domain-containing protein [Gemmobacter sp.]
MAPLASSADLTASSDALLDDLAARGIGFDRHDHPPLRTVADSKEVQHLMCPGALHIRNLYLRDRKKRNFLVVLEQDRAVDLKVLGAAIGARELSFGSPDRLMEFLGILPGAVSPLAMLTGARTGVVLVLDRAVERAERIYMHPLINDRSIGMAPEELLSWLAGLGVTPLWLD